MSFLLFLLVAPYLAPTGIAAYRNLRAKNVVFVLNLLTGWTFVGWVASLIWACAGEPTIERIEAAGDASGPKGLLLQGRDPRIS